jgi:phosphoribosylformylglycinamidine cyclo-ligase
MTSEYVGKYPEISHPTRGRYTGGFKYDDYVDELGSTVSDALLSPTRLFSPLALKVLENHRGAVHGMVHNTGGGNTKCLRLGKGIHYVKDSMLDPDPIFELIKAEAGVTWEEMYQDFNMGVGFEFIVDPESAEDILSVIEGYGVGTSIIGKCLEAQESNTLMIESGKGSYSYT